MKSNALLMGPLGTGKTRALETLCNCGVSVRVIALEPGIEDVLGHISCPTLHWHYIPLLRLDWDSVTSFIHKMNKMGVGLLADATDPNRTQYNQFFEVFSACQNFVCDRCGVELGCVDNWSDKEALAIDGLTGLCKVAMQTLVGAKPFVSLPEYKAGQEAVMALMNMCLPLRCWFILLAHTDREILHESGKLIETAHAIGNKLAPQLTKSFSEVIRTRREGTNFYWATDMAGSETKARRLPWSDKLRPDFAQLFKE